MSDPKIIILPTSMLDPTPVRFDCPYWDLLPPLSPAEHAALKTSMEEHGQKTALTVVLVRLDHYRVLDGWHRLSIGESLNYSAEDVPIHSIGDDDGYTEEQLHDLAIELNLRRRHLSAEQRAEWAVKLRLQGKSYREIADLTGSSKSQVARDLSTVPSGTVALPETITGRDGKERSSTMPPREAKEEIIPPEEKALTSPVQASLFTGVTIPTPLLITSKVESSTRAMDMYDAAEAKRWPLAAPGAEAHRASPVTPTSEPSLEYVEYGKGQEEPSPSSQSSLSEAKPTATQAEVAASVEASFVKAGPLDPKTLLPLICASAECGRQAWEGGRFCASHHTDPASIRSLQHVTQPKIVGVEDSIPTNGRKPGYQHYNTPNWLLDLIRKVNPIAIDPCSNQWSMVGAEISFDVHQDGLACDWASLSKDAGLVYVNPPYSDVTPWAERAIEYAKLGAEVVLCLPTSHSTAWYKLLRKGCQALAQLGRKVDFGEEGIFAATAKHETTLFYFGPQRVLYREVFEADGHWVSEEGCAHYHAPLPPDTRQIGLPFPAAPKEEESLPTPLRGPTREEKLLMGDPVLTREVKEEKPPLDRMGSCARCGALCHPMRPCACASEAKPEEPRPRLHASLKAVAKGYQQEGYEVRILTPRQKGQAASSKSVLGYLGGVADRDVIQHSAIRDEQEDAYEILFSTNKGLICTLHAIKKEAPKEEDRNEWLAKAIEEIKSKNYASQVDETGKRLLPEAPTELDRQYFAAFLIEWKHEKPPAKPYNYKAPAPKRIKGKEEGPIRGTVAKKGRGK